MKPKRSACTPALTAIYGEGTYLHVNSHPEGLDGSRSWHCDCGRHAVAHGHPIISQEAPMTAPDMTGGWKMLDRDDYPDATITYLVQLPNGEYIEGDHTRGDPAPNHKIFTDIRDAKEAVISRMLKAKELGIDNYKPVIITRQATHTVHLRHMVDPEHGEWIEDNAATLRGELAR